MGYGSRHFLHSPLCEMSEANREKKLAEVMKNYGILPRDEDTQKKMAFRT